MKKMMTRRALTKTGIAAPLGMRAIGVTRLLKAGEPNRIAGSAPGFHKTITELEVVTDSRPTDPSRPAPTRRDIDLVAMARWALEALKKNPRPHLDYECRFSMSLLRYPPGPGPNDHDLWTFTSPHHPSIWPQCVSPTYIPSCARVSMKFSTLSRVTMPRTFSPSTTGT